MIVLVVMDVRQRCRKLVPDLGAGDRRGTLVADGDLRYVTGWPETNTSERFDCVTDKSEMSPSSDIEPLGANRADHPNLPAQGRIRWRWASTQLNGVHRDRQDGPTKSVNGTKMNLGRVNRDRRKRERRLRKHADIVASIKVSATRQVPPSPPRRHRTATIPVWCPAKVRSRAAQPRPHSVTLAVRHRPKPRNGCRPSPARISNSNRPPSSDGVDQQSDVGTPGQQFHLQVTFSPYDLRFVAELDAPLPAEDTAGGTARAICVRPKWSMTRSRSPRNQRPADPFRRTRSRRSSGRSDHEIRRVRSRDQLNEYSPLHRSRLWRRRGSSSRTEMTVAIIQRQLNRHAHPLLPVRKTTARVGIVVNRPDNRGEHRDREYVAILKSLKQADCAAFAGPTAPLLGPPLRRRRLSWLACHSSSPFACCHRCDHLAVCRSRAALVARSRSPQDGPVRPTWAADHSQPSVPITPTRSQDAGTRHWPNRRTVKVDKAHVSSNQVIPDPEGETRRRRPRSVS